MAMLSLSLLVVVVVSEEEDFDPIRLVETMEH